MTYRHLQTYSAIRTQIIANGLESDFYYKGKDAFYGGYNLEQNPDELAQYIFTLKSQYPNGIDHYLEIGVATCGLVRTMCEFVGVSHVVIVDDGSWQSNKRDENLAEIKKLVETLDIVALKSQSQEARDYLENVYKDYSPDVIMIDGDHSYEGVCGDIYTALLIADDMTVIAMHDVESKKDPGVKKAMQTALDTNTLTLGQTIMSNDNPLGIAILLLNK